MAASYRRLLKHKSLIAYAKAKSEKAFLVINKIDLLESPALLPIIAQYRDKFPFVEIVPISAKNPSDVLRLRDLIVTHLPTGPLYFPDDQISDLPERFFVAETVRGENLPEDSTGDSLRVGRYG